MVACIDGARELRDFVHQTLCDRHELTLGGFPFTERPLTRRGKPCGIFFCQYGPRSVKFTAIWDAERNVVLFYGSSGERILKVELSEHAGL